MEGIKHSRQFAETESLMDNYFVCHIAPVMKQTQAYLNEKQGEEMMEYSTSLGGILSMMATAGQPLGDPYQTLKVTGEWNSKTTEDYIAMCRERIVSSEEMQQDLACIAGQWRRAAVQEIGRERYDELSEKLGCDLAYAYVDYRMEQLMIDRLVRERMPKSSAEYIIRKAAESSLLGLPQVLGRSPLAEEIEARGEAAYRPSKAEKGAAWALGATADTVMLGGAGSWATFAKFIGADAAVSTVVGYLEKDKPEGPTVEACISKGVFGIDGNVFDTFRKEAAAIPPKENGALAEANNVLHKKIPVYEFDFTKWMEVGNTQWWPDFGTSVHDREEKYKDVPLIVAPGQEEAYLRELERQKAEEKDGQAAAQEEQREENRTEPQVQNRGGEETAAAGQENPSASAGQSNENGWDGLLRSVGLDGLGDITGNLGYIMAMLPDILLGAFTGKTQSLRLKDNLLPMASIVAGLFVRNPLLKMLLIGLGGANLLNKAGHEALERKRSEGLTAGNREPEYKRYPDEPLNPRIVNPTLQGCTLVATIDRVPCTVQLSPVVADAYRKGALPLNTLANAVLAQSDRLNQMASQNYDNSRPETVVRTRGIQ